MWADSFRPKRRHIVGRAYYGSAHQRINTKASERLSQAIQEYSFVLSTNTNQCSENVGCLWPQRTMTYLVPLAQKGNRRGAAPSHIPDRKARCLIRSGACVVEEQKERVVAGSLFCVSVRRLQYCIHLGLFQVSDRSSSCFLERHIPYLRAPGDMFRAMSGDELSKYVDGSQPLMSCGDTAVTLLLEMLQKPP